MINEISNLIKKFRKAATMLESLLEDNPINNPKVARKIKKSMDLNGSIPTVEEKPKRKYNKKKKPHWASTPEGKLRMSALMKKAYADGRKKPVNKKS